MHRTDLVARWIAQVGEIDLARCPFTPTGRILDALATISDTSIVEGPGFLSAVAHEADRAAVGARRGIAVDGLGDAKRASFGAIEDAPLRIGLSLRDAACRRTWSQCRSGAAFLGRAPDTATAEDIRRFTGPPD